MGTKLLWLGLTFLMAGNVLALPVEIIGQILMVIGVILLFLDK
jgi:hypothetical protein